MTALTPRQEVLLAFLRDYQLKHGFAPSIREMQLHLGNSSVNGVLVHLVALEKKGVIRRAHKIARGIQVLR